MTRADVTPVGGGRWWRVDEYVGICHRLIPSMTCWQTCGIVSPTYIVGVWRMTTCWCVFWILSPTFIRHGVLTRIRGIRYWVTDLQCTRRVDEYEVSAPIYRRHGVLTSMCCWCGVEWWWKGLTACRWWRGMRTSRQRVCRHGVLTNIRDHHRFGCLLQIEKSRAIGKTYKWVGPMRD